MTRDMARSVSVEDREILESFGQVDDPIRTVPNMAEDIELGVDGLRKRLGHLESEGKVKSKKVGARSVVWWRVD